MSYAKYVTPNNIEYVGGEIQDAADYILDRIEVIVDKAE